MKALVKYVDFHWDNYQGGSGKSFDLTLSVDVPDDLKACEFFDFIHKQMDTKVKHERPFQQDTVYSIKTVEIV